MGLRGPKKEPTALLALRGSKVAKYTRRDPAVQAGIPACPAYVPKPGQEIWQRLTTHLAAAGLIAQVDADLLGRYCVLSLLWLDAVAGVSAHGMVTERMGLAGDMVRQVQPEARLILEYHAALARIEASFGVSPSARASIGAAIKAAEPVPEGGKDKSRFFRKEA